MRVVLQTVNKASVEIENTIVGKINAGYLLLVGFTQGDNQEIVNRMADKILKLRVFPDQNGQTNLSLYDVVGDILSVSQFTLYADTSGGRRPSFVNALNPKEATILYDYFNAKLEELYNRKIEKGIFHWFQEKIKKVEQRMEIIQ